MSETPKLRLATEGEQPTKARVEPNRYLLKPDEVNRLEVALGDGIHKVGGNRLGNEMLAFSLGEEVQARAVTKLMSYLTADPKKPAFHRIAPLSTTLEMPGREGMPVIAFAGLDQPEAIAATAHGLINETNSLLTDLGAPIHIPDEPK